MFAEITSLLLLFLILKQMKGIKHVIGVLVGQKGFY